MRCTLCCRDRHNVVHDAASCIDTRPLGREGDLDPRRFCDNYPYKARKVDSAHSCDISKAFTGN